MALYTLEIRNMYDGQVVNASTHEANDIEKIMSWLAPCGPIEDMDYDDEFIPSIFVLFKGLDIIMDSGRC
jgi:hypothetical protein